MTKQQPYTSPYRLRKISFLTVFFLSFVVMIGLIGYGHWTLTGGATPTRSTAMGASGILCLMLMFWQSALGIRPVTAAWIKDFFWVNGLHKWLGIGTFMLLLFHPIAVVFAYQVGRDYAIVPDFSSTFEMRVSAGRVAFILTLIVLITSILSRKILSFRKWHYLHLLAYPIMIGAWIHGFQTGTLIYSIPAIKYYWIAIGIWIVLITAFRLAYQFGFLKLRSKVISHISVSDDVNEIAFELPRDVNYIHGQFAYLQYKRGGEAHPFTILSYDKDSRIMKIAYKRIWNFTQKLNQVKSQISEVFIDGPYGEFTAEVNENSPIVCIAGGIGITPFYYLLTQSKNSNAQLIYLNKTPQEAVYLSELSDSLKKDLICVFSRSKVEGKTEHTCYGGSRLSKQILQEILPKNLTEVNYYLYASKPVIESTKNLLLSLGISVSNIHWEPFEM